ncbi:MAG: hypothetical protein LBS21_04555 [Clostridiales bacterium]|jgi:hypothetical protein|nr:hypothetical protein [Clostridiales bacterium]
MEENAYGMSIPNENEAKSMLGQNSETEGYAGLVQPMSYDIELAKEKGLCPDSKFDEKYLKMQALYREELEKFLNGKLNLGKYDNLLSDSDLRFITVAEDEKSFYQKYSTFGFKYIYLRNNLPIERLSKEELKILERNFETKNAVNHEELQELVERTYKAVIFTYNGVEADTIIIFSNDGQKKAPNSALVFEIGHSSEFDENGNYVDRSNEKNKRIYLANEFIPMMQKDLSEVLGTEVVVFVN